jgi:hypothetical protein
MGRMNRVLVECHRAKKCKPPKEIRGVKMIWYYSVQESSMRTVRTTMSLKMTMMNGERSRG